MASAGTARAPITPQARNTNVRPTTSTNPLRAAAYSLYAVAVLSLLNPVTEFLGLKVHYLTAMGMADWISAQGNSQAAAALVSFIIGIWVATLFVLLGAFARRAERWALLTGMAIYAVDGFFVRLAKDVPSLILNLFVLFMIWREVARMKSRSNRSSSVETPA